MTAPNRTIPESLTAPVKEVLGIMCFQAGPLCDVFRAAGHTIPPKAEDEQAFIIHRFLLLALEHGENWRSESVKDVNNALAKAKEKP